MTNVMCLENCGLNHNTGHTLLHIH